MNFKLTLFASSAMLLSLNASELIQPSDSREFPYIKPVAVEYKMIDSDKDGVLDIEDKCPNTPKGAVVDAVGCEQQAAPQTAPQALVQGGCEPDSDKDGVFDSKDECPNTPPEVIVNRQGCEIDCDEDGVVDSKDKCPRTPKGFKVDSDGCPLMATLKANFDTDKYNVTDEILNEAKIFAQFLNDNVGYKAILSGHTDSTGDEEKNKILSQNRANAIRDALVSFGVDRSRLTAIGKASTEPVASNATVEGRAQNRRTEVQLVK